MAFLARAISWLRASRLLPSALRPPIPAGMTSVAFRARLRLRSLASSFLAMRSFLASFRLAKGSSSGSAPGGTSMAHSFVSSLQHGHCYESRRGAGGRDLARL